MNIFDIMALILLFGFVVIGISLLLDEFSDSSYFL